MTAYKRNLFAWACIMIVGLTLIALSLYVSTWFLAPFFGIVFFAQFVLKRIVCPKCGTPVTFQGKIAGVRIQGGLIRKKCQQCGWDLNTNP
jgi:hypothetical protein